MKTIKLFSVKIILVLICLMGIQSIQAEDVLVPLRRDTFQGATNPTRSSRTKVFIPLTAIINGSDLTFFYSSNVGICTVSVLDANNNIEFVEVINTDVDTEFHFDLTGLDFGTHTVQISYGSVNLTGEFYLEY